MNRLMNTKSWKACNILKLCENFMQGKEFPQSTSPIKKDNHVSPWHLARVDTWHPTPPGLKDNPIGARPTTKSQNLKWMGNENLSMLTEFKQMQEDERENLSHKRLHVQSKENLNKAKVKETKAKRE